MRMGQNVCYAPLNTWRPEIICSSNVTSVLGYGHIFKLTGHWGLIWCRWQQRLERLFRNLSLLRLCSLLGGISGWSGMPNASNMRGHPLQSGNWASSMTSLCLVIGSNLGLKMNYLDGLTFCPLEGPFLLKLCCKSCKYCVALIKCWGCLTLQP